MEDELIRGRIVLGIRYDKELSRKPSQFKQQRGHSKKTKASAPRTTGNKDPTVECGHCGGK